MKKNGVNIFRGSDEEINEKFLAWSEETDLVEPKNSMLLPDDVLELFEEQCSNKVNKHEVEYKLT